MKHQCNFCNNYFSTKTNLNNHQRKAKYCLKLQGSSRLKDASICDACGKVSTSKWNHQLHAEKCKKSSRIFTLIDSNDKLKRKNEDLNVSVKMLSKQVDDKNNTIKELKTQIQILQDKLENIAIKAVQRPTTTNNMNKTRVECAGNVSNCFRWVNYVGHCLIKSVEVEIGGQRIDKHYGDWLTIK